LEKVRGYLVIQVEEASGKTQKDQFTWDTNIGSAFEAFVKVEIRGSADGPRSVKAQTKKAPLIGEKITWREDLRLELLEGANELRLMLCREKFQGTKRGTSVIAACGIFVSDILDAVPIDKYFELFKPNAGGEGGFIRIGMSFVKDLSELKKADASAQNLAPAIAFTAPSSAKEVAHRLQGVVSEETAGEVARRVAGMGNEGGSKKKGRGKKVVLPLLLVAAAGAVTGIILGRKK